MVNVAIIDDGIGAEVYKGLDVKYSIEITPELEIKSIDENVLMKRTHGTTCASIVRKYCNEVIFTSIKVLNSKSHKGQINQVIKAIEWCMKNNIRVVNLSIGTINYKDFMLLKHVINKAYEKNLIMVAACDNKNVFTYPASCSNVIGVKSGEFYQLNEGEYIFNLYPLDGIQVTACSQHKLIKYNSQLDFTYKCNSYAAPMITAKVCNIISKFPEATLEQVKQRLYEASINYSKNEARINNYKNIDWANNIALLNLNIREEKIKLPFIDNVTILKDIDEVTSSSFDTVVVLNEDKDNYKDVNNIIESVERIHKNIIVLDDEVDDCECRINYPNDKVKFWHKSLINNFYVNVSPKKQIDVPLIVIYGHRDDQIITVTKTLVDKFKSNGYYAGGMCAKTLGILYGLEYIPLNKDVNVDDIKNKIEILQEINVYDLIIYGFNIKNHNINTINDINYSLKPDKTILFIDDYVDERVNYLNDFDNNDTLIITSKYNPIKKENNYNKVFHYSYLDEIYNSILNEFQE